jgi:hypothetical protein
VVTSEELRRERQRTALYRFYVYTTDHDQYPHSVLDRALGVKTIAKFKERKQALLFLDARKAEYIETGE